jgi:hypothetical protein
MCLKTTMCEIHEVLAKINPTYDFTERIAVSLGAFATSEYTRDMPDALTSAHWTKVAVLLTSLKIATQIVQYTTLNGTVKTYLDRIENAIPELPSTCDSEAHFSTLTEQSQQALANVGCILAEADFSCLGEETSAHLGTVVALLQSASGPAAGPAQSTRAASA